MDRWATTNPVPVQLKEKPEPTLTCPCWCGLPGYVGTERVDCPIHHPKEVR